MKKTNNIINYIFAFCFIFVYCTPKANAIIYYNDGQTHDLIGSFGDDIFVDVEHPGLQTTINWSALLIDHHIIAYNDSKINILGGTIDEYLRADHRSQIVVDNGSIGGLLVGYDNTQITINGGSIGTDLIAGDNSNIYIFGGTIGRDLIAYATGTVTIEGWGFYIDGVPVDYGEITSINGSNYFSEPVRHLSGWIGEPLNPIPINNDFYIGHSAKIILVPEPSTLLLLGLGTFILRRKR